MPRATKALPTVPFHLFRSFRAQLALCFALLGAGLGLVLALVLGSMLADSSRRDAGARLNGIAGHSARLLSNGLALRLREVRILADSPTLWTDGLASPRVAQVLFRSQALTPHNVWLGVADAGGTVRVATGDMLLGQPVAARPWFSGALAGPYVGDVHPAKLLAPLLPPASDGGPQRFVDFAAPIRRDGRVIGVIAIHGSWDGTRDTLEALLPVIGQRNGVELLVFDRGGQMISAPAGSLQRHLDAGQTLPAALAASPGSAVVTRWADGVDHLSTRVDLPLHGDATDLGWTVVARQPVAAAYAPAREAIAAALLLGAATAVMAALLGWALAAGLTRPLRQMADAARALDPASPHARWAAHRGSREIELLSQALGTMTDGLVQANARLEQRVAERTVELQHANAALLRLAAHDPLTSLLNRRGLDERATAVVAGARRRSMPVSVLLVDADHFKRVNDTHGHEVGDQVLVAIAQCLKKRLREVDVVARIGGEEFVVLLPDTGSLGASHVAGHLIQAVQATPMPQVGRVTISCGVAEMDVEAESIDDVLRRADAALYQAKHGGRNGHRVAPAPRAVAA